MHSFYLLTTHDKIMGISYCGRYADEALIMPLVEVLYLKLLLEMHYLHTTYDKIMVHYCAHKSPYTTGAII